MPADLTLPRSRRIRFPSEFRRIYEQGTKRVGRNMVAFLQAGEPDGRIGVVASKKVGNAVARARAKRRLRSLYRLHQHELQPGFDLVLVSRRDILTTPWPVLVDEYHALGAKLGFLTSHEEK